VKEEADIADNWDEEDVDVLVGKVQAKSADAVKMGEEDAIDVNNINTAGAAKVIVRATKKKTEEEKIQIENDVFSKANS
jgi:hypothetical protein